MENAVAIIGVIAQSAAQRWVAHRPRTTWATMGALFCVLIPLTLATGSITLSISSTSLGIGVVAGVLLYAATRLFLAATRDWTSLRRDTTTLYSVSGTLPRGVEILIGGFVAIGEELFWRGLIIAVLTPPLGVSMAALSSLVLSIMVAAASASRPVVAAAVVGGGVWTGLVVWGAGGLASAIVCHVIWSALMIAFPGGDAAASEGPNA